MSYPYELVLWWSKFPKFSWIEKVRVREKLGFSSSENNLTSSLNWILTLSSTSALRLTLRSTLTSPHPLNLLHLIHLVSVVLKTVHIHRHTNMGEHHINKQYHCSQTEEHTHTHKHGLHVRSGSLVAVNQLSALQTPTVLSSLQTNPVRRAAAEQRRGPESPHSLTNTDHCWDMRRNTAVELTSRQSCVERKEKFIREKKKKKVWDTNSEWKEHKNGSSKKKEKKEARTLSWERVWGRRRRRGKKRGNKSKGVCVKRGKHSPPPPSPPPVPSVNPTWVGGWLLPFFLQRPTLPKPGIHPIPQRTISAL